MGGTIRVINCAEIAADGWTFLKDKIDQPGIQWSFFSATPINFLERAVRRPRVSRYRACFQAAYQSKEADVVISHLPRTTCWIAIFMRLLGARARHLAFSFNFTTLPRGVERWLMSKALRYVDRFVVFSNAEKTLYAKYFWIAEEKIDVVPWAMNVPACSPDTPPVTGDYICAIGGEGRDYKVLLDAVRALPHVQLVMVVRPESLHGLSVPENVRVMTNLPNAEFWNVVRFSRFVVIPLRDAHTNCGHISIVGSMLFSKAIVSTYSAGTEDYVTHGENALLSPAGDVDALRAHVQRLWSHPEMSVQLGAAGYQRTKEHHGEEQWASYVVEYLSQSRRSNDVTV